MGAGTDLNCGNGWDNKGCRGNFSRAHDSPCHGYTAIPEAIKQGLATEAQVMMMMMMMMMMMLVLLLLLLMFSLAAGHDRWALARPSHAYRALRSARGPEGEKFTENEKKRSPLLCVCVSRLLYSGSSD